MDPALNIRVAERCPASKSGQLAPKRRAAAIDKDAP
jgi:hypothetical protein